MQEGFSSVFKLLFIFVQAEVGGYIFIAIVWPHGPAGTARGGEVGRGGMVVNLAGFLRAVGFITSLLFMFICYFLICNIMLRGKLCHKIFF